MKLIFISARVRFKPFNTKEKIPTSRVLGVQKVPWVGIKWASATKSYAISRVFR